MRGKETSLPSKKKSVPRRGGDKNHLSCLMDAAEKNGGRIHPSPQNKLVTVLKNKGRKERGVGRGEKTTKKPNRPGREGEREYRLREEGGREMAISVYIPNILRGCFGGGGGGRGGGGCF